MLSHTASQRKVCFYLLTNAHSLQLRIAYNDCDLFYTTSCACTLYYLLTPPPQHETLLHFCDLLFGPAVSYFIRFSYKSVLRMFLFLIQMSSAFRGPKHFFETFLCNPTNLFSYGRFNFHVSIVYTTIGIQYSCFILYPLMYFTQSYSQVFVFLSFLKKPASPHMLLDSNFIFTKTHKIYFAFICT